MKPITIKTAGVIRCCLASIGGDYVDEEKVKWKAFDNPKEGDTDTCEYCGREFALVGRRWEPTDQPNLGKYRKGHIGRKEE